MRILWFSLSPCGSTRRHGAERYIQGWMTALEDVVKAWPGVELSVAYYADRPETPFTYEGVTYHPLCRGNSGPLRRVLSRHRPLGYDDDHCLRLLLGVVEAVRPDVIHLHGTEENFGLLLDRVGQTPVCVSLQGLMGPIAERYFAGFTRQDYARYQGFFERLKGVSCTQEQRRMVAKGQREAAFLQRARCVLGRTDWDRSVCRLLAPQARYFTVGELLRREFYEAKWDKPAFSPNIQIVSILSSGQVYKGLDTLLKTARLLTQQAPFPFEWLVVGYTGDEWQIDMAERTVGVRLNDCHVKCCGIKDAGALSTLLAEADVYCHPSHIENSPNSVCEAQLIGTPVVATCVGGTASLLQGCGLLVSDGDPYGLAGALVEMVSDYERARSWSQRGRALACERHDPARVSDQLMAAYRWILEAQD